MKRKADPKPSDASETEPKNSKPGLIVFGRDQRGRPHCAWFQEQHGKQAVEAAAIMGFNALPLEDESRGLARGMTEGRLFVSGRALVPLAMEHVFRAVNDALEAMIARERATLNGGMSEAREVSQSAAGTDNLRVFHLPREFESIGVNSLVLVCETPAEGWFEAVTIGQPSADLFELRWRDWPDLPTVVRRRGDLALLPLPLAV